MNASQLTYFFWFLTDNQTVIRDFPEHPKENPGMIICARISRALEALIQTRPGAKVALIWCPFKKTVERMKRVDVAAKEAVHLWQLISIPPNPTAPTNRIKTQLTDTATARPAPEIVKCLMGSFNPKRRARPCAAYRAQRRPSSPRSGRGTAL